MKEILILLHLRWPHRRALRAAIILTLLLTGICAAALWPTTTFQGIDQRVSARRIPAYVKTVDFFQRHFQYRLLASQICENRTDVDCTLALLDWTHTNIAPTPAGWPVVDDHPLNIIIRRYGQSDQMADVFTLLAVYAGVPAFFRFVRHAERREILVLAFARLEGRWVPFDVEHHIVFRDRQGRLTDIQELIGDPGWVDTLTGDVRPSGLPYSSFISKATLEPFIVPSPLRARMQQPWPRAHHELRRLVGLERE